NAERRRCLCNSIAEDKRHALLDSETPGSNAVVAKPFGDTLIRTFILLPCANLRTISSRAGCDLFACTVFLECRANVEGISFCRKDHREEPLAIPPANVGEIHERRPADHHDRIETVLYHQLPRSFDALLALLNRDRLRFRLS